MTKTNTIITAGGSGRRFDKKQKKQYFEIAGKAILYWTTKVFYEHNQINKVIVCTPSEDVEYVSNLLQDFSTKVVITKGGQTRQESVFNGLKSCDKDTEIVLIHDGVRPFILTHEIDSLIKQTRSDKAVIPVTKVKYTIKKFHDRFIDCTVNRDELFEVHTPQTFAFDMIYDLHDKAKKEGFNLTDDAGLCEYYGIPVFYQLCSSYNIKITNPEDSAIANAIMRELYNKGDVRCV